MDSTLASFTDVLDSEICDSQPISLSPSSDSHTKWSEANAITIGGSHGSARPCKGTGQRGFLRSNEEIDPKYRDVFTYKYFNLVQSKVIDDALYSDKSIVVSAPTGSGKTVVFEMAIVQLLMELEEKQYTEDFKIIYMAPVKALCTERLTEWYPKFTKLGLLCIEATGDTDVDFSQLQPYKIIITTPEKWDMLTRRWRDHRSLVEVIKLFLIDEVHILNDETRGPVLEAVVSRMKTIEGSAQSVHRIEKLQNQLQGSAMTHQTAPSIRFVAVSATVSNPEDVAEWLGTSNKPAVFHKFGDECRPVPLNRIVEGYPCPAGTSIFKFDITLNYKLWPIIQKYHRGKPTLIFCNTRKSVTLTAETLSRELTINFNAEQKAKLTTLASTIKNKKLQSLVMNGVGCHHAGLLYEERQMIERAFRNRDLPILITTTTLAMGVNLPAHLVIIKNTQQYVNGTFQEYSISTVLQMVGRAGRPQFDTDATAVIMTRLADKSRYQSLVGGCEPLQSYLHKRLPENLNSETALGTVGDVAQCVQWLRSTFLYVRAARDPKRYLGLSQNSPQHLISKKIEELCVKAMNGLASSGLITMDDASCIESTEAGRLMSIFYLDVETMKLLMRIEGTETLERLLTIICESHELSDMHLRIDERRCLNALNRNNAAATIRFPMKGKISTRQMKLNCVIQAVLGCLAIPDPSLNQEAMKIMRITDRICKCLVAYVTRPDLISRQPKFYSAVLNSITLAKCITAHLWENSPFVSKQLKGIGPTFSMLLATAGKVNFIMLEESHPRDLERIMNKGPPAGNVLRRQITLLPKYQLSMTPIDENTVMVQLNLLNQSYLAGNIEHLTAGGTHKCYIVVGDSTNHLLLLASFKDTDLLRVFDGTMTHEIRRQHSYEHRIFAHCISSTYVGLDVQSEYVFKDLNKLFGTPNINYNINAIVANDSVEQKSETCRKRKRNKSTDSDKNQSKEKKKRENAVIKNFNYLKKTFDTHSKNVKEIMNFPTKKHVLLKNEKVKHSKTTPEYENVSEDKAQDEYRRSIVEDNEFDNFIGNDEKINNILTEIENEMFERKSCQTKINLFSHTNISKTDNHRDSLALKDQTISKSKSAYMSNTKIQKSLPAKSNYTFIDLLERNLDLSDNDDTAVPTTGYNGFSENIKSHISKYIQKTQTETKTHDPNVQLFLVNNDVTKPEMKEYSSKKQIIDSNSEEVLPTQVLYPHYEIKEILDGQKYNNRTEVKSKKIEQRTISPKELVAKGASTVGIDYKTTPQNKDALIPFRIPLDALKESNLSLDNQNNLNTLCDLNEHSTKPDDPQDAKEPYSGNIKVDYEDFQTETNGSIPLLEKENNRNKKIEATVNYFFSNKQKCNNTVDTIPIETSNIDRNDLSLPVYYANPNKTYGSNRIYSIDKNPIQHNSQGLKEISNEHCQKGDDLLLRHLLMVEDDKSATTPKKNSLAHSDENQIITVAIKANDTNPKIMSEPVYINNYNQPKIMNSISSCNRNRNEYVKKYSFSTTQIDIQDKDMTDCSIRVIKEVKMDFNITAIVSTGQQRQSYRSQSDVTKSEKIKALENNPLTKPTDYHIDIGSYCISDKAANHCIEPTLNRFLKNKDKTNNIVSLATENMKNMIYERSDINNIEINSFPSISQDLEKNENTEPFTILNNTQTNKNNLSEDLEGITYLLGPTIEETEENDYVKTVKAQPKEVHNILQKYSKILGQESTKNLPPVYTARNKNTTYKRSPPKSKKPFKINKIKELQTAIPEKIIDCCKQYEQKDQHIAIAMKTVKNKSILEKNEETECYSSRFNEHSINECSSDLMDIDLEPLHIPTEIHLEPDINYNIDQSMFDPKTLIQFTVDSDNEEIISPPPQFCDLKINSQNYNDPEESNVINSKGFDEQKNILSTDKDYNYNESIFEDYCTTNLTPSREIETWTLQDQECLDDSNSSFSLSPAKSFTVIRRTNFMCYNPSDNKVMSQQQNLGKFKFNHKNKLKRWK